MTKPPQVHTDFLTNNFDPETGHQKTQGPLGIVPGVRQRLCGDIGLHIDYHGDWYYQGSLIARKELVRLFYQVLLRDAAGNHWLITPMEIAPVDVAEVAHVITGIKVIGSGLNQIIKFKTKVGTSYELSTAYPLRIEVNPKTNEPAPYLALDHGLEGKLNRAIFYDLANMAVSQTIDHTKRIGVWSAGLFHIIGDPE